jgi:hypothetical protein
MLFQRGPGWATDWRAPARERMNSRRPDGKLEAGLCQALHFFGDFDEILSIYFIAPRRRRRSFQNDFVEDMELSFVLHRASDEARFDSRIPLRLRANRGAHIRSRRDQTRLRRCRIISGRQLKQTGTAAHPTPTEVYVF